MDEQRSSQAESLPTLVQRSASFTALNDHRSVSNQGHCPVPNDEVGGRRLMPLGELTDCEVLTHDGRLKVGILAGVGLRQRSSKDGDRPSASLHSRCVGGCIDPPSESAHDNYLLQRKRLGKV